MADSRHFEKRKNAISQQWFNGAWSMEYHYEYSTYSSHHKVHVNLQASNVDALKSNSCVLFTQICVFTSVA